MLRSVTALFSVLFITSAAMAADVGKPAPAFKGVDVVSGKEVSSDALKGKVTVLEWNNFECPFVKKFYGSGTMQKLQANAVNDGVVWVTINSSAAGKQGHFTDAAEAKAAVGEHRIAASYYMLDHDGAIGKAYGAKTTPHMYVIDQEGTLVYQGAIDDKPTSEVSDIAGATNYVTAALASLKAAKPVETGTTRAYGCSVKY